MIMMESNQHQNNSCNMAVDNEIGNQPLLQAHSEFPASRDEKRQDTIVGIKTNLNVRRVSEPEIDTRQHGVLTEDDISVSSSEASHDASEAAGSKEEDNRRTSSEAEVNENTHIKPEDNLYDHSYNQLFRMWYKDRVGRRRYPSVLAYPSLPSNQGFGNTTVDGYSFETYFDRWYREQKVRSRAFMSSNGIATHAIDANRKRSFEDLNSSPTIPLDKKRAKTPTSGGASSIQQQRNLNSLHKWNAANALFRPEIVELPSSFTPGPFTVIMGRRLKAPGCVHLRGITDQFAAEYKTGSSMDKSRIVTHILKLVYDLCPIGAFVRSKGGVYFEVEDLIAREKIVSELISGGLQIVPDEE